MNKVSISFWALFVITLAFVGVGFSNQSSSPVEVVEKANKPKTTPNECIHVLVEGIGVGQYPRQGVVNAIWPNTIVLGDLTDDIGFYSTIYTAKLFPDLVGRIYHISKISIHNRLSDGYLGHIEAGRYRNNLKFFTGTLDRRPTTTPQGISGWYAHGAIYSDNDRYENYYAFAGVVEDGVIMLNILDQGEKSEELFHQLLSGVDFTVDSASKNPIRGKVKPAPCTSV